MFIKFEISDSARANRGTVRLKLDWRAMSWLLIDDAGTVWKGISPEKSGRFEHKDWGVLWIWDSVRHLFIVLNAPTSGDDLFCSASNGRIFSPENKEFQDGMFNWEIDFTASLNASSPTPPAVSASSPFREHIIKRLHELLDAPYLSKNYDLMTGSLRRHDPAVKGTEGNYTSCGSMPGFVTSEMGLFKGLKGQAHYDYMKRYSLNGTNSIRIKGKKYHCWKENNLTDRPSPGDIYGLLMPKSHDKEAGLFSHVGVIQECTGNIWKTMDLGAGTGFDGKKNVERPYKAYTGELYGESNQGGGYRVLAGWVNIDEYIKLG